MAGYSARVKWDHRERMSAAWHGAAFERSKKMPKLTEVLGDEETPKQRSNDQMLQMLRSIQKQSGGLTIVKVVCRVMRSFEASCGTNGRGKCRERGCQKR